MRTHLGMHDHTEGEHITKQGKEKLDGGCSRIKMGLD